MCPFSYETVASILQTTGPTDAAHPHCSSDTPCLLSISDDELCLHEVDAGVLFSPEPDPLIPTSVDISPPPPFSDNQTISDHTDLAHEPKCSASRELSLVASLRLAASEQEKERELERERREKERIENEEREKERRRLEREREEMERKERERVEREKEEERRRLEKEREEMERKKGEEGKRLEKEQYIKRADMAEKKGNEEQERNTDRESEKKGEEERGRQRTEDRKGEKPQQKRETISVSSLQNKQEVMNNQSDDWPPLMEAELDDIAYDERLQSDEEQSERKSDPKLVKIIDPKSEVKLVSARPADSVPTTRQTAKVDSGRVKPDNSVSDVKKGQNHPALRSVKKGNVKSGAIPVWLREEEDEEVEYERGQEDLGSIWLAELYMEGEAG